MNSLPQQPVSSSNPIVFLDINIGKEFAGRIIIELRKDVVPKTAENFRALATGECGVGTLGKKLHYKGLRFHKVTRLFVAQSGDVVNNNGTSGESIYGPLFEDENFILPHDEGAISMANYGKPNTNNSQFVITTVVAENLNGTNVVVGHVLRGFGIVLLMEQHTNDVGQPTEEIVIVDCGEIAAGEDWCIVDTDEGEYRVPPYPQDWDLKLNNFQADDILALLIGIRNAGNRYYAQSDYYDALRKYHKADRYYKLMSRRFHSNDLKHLKFNEGDLQKFDKFAVLNFLNMAAVEIKLENFAKAKLECTEALRLDNECSKALYRRGVAHVALKNYEEAIEDLRRANELMPDEKQIQSVLNNAKQLLSEYNREQMSALKNLFN